MKRVFFLGTFRYRLFSFRRIIMSLRCSAAIGTRNSWRPSEIYEIIIHTSPEERVRKAPVKLHARKVTHSRSRCWRNSRPASTYITCTFAITAADYLTSSRARSYNFTTTFSTHFTIFCVKFAKTLGLLVLRTCNLQEFSAIRHESPHTVHPL